MGTNYTKKPKFNKKATKGRINKSSSDSAVESKSNDSAWYGSTPQLVRDAASLAYSYPLGSKFKLGDTYSSVPGLMRYMIHPSVGISTNDYSPINVASRNIYSYVRHANSGHSNYDAPDLMLYLMAMDSIYSLYSHLVRVYGVATLYTQKNRYYPRAILEGLFCDPDDIVSHLADFRYYINSFVKKMGSMCVPASMTLFKRHMWMYEGLYVDDNSTKAQTYFMCPKGFYKYNELDGAGRLDFVEYDNTEYTVEGLIAYADNLITTVLRSEDLNIMSGDILKAYGTDGVFKVSGIDANYIVLPTFNEEVLSQIQNASIFEPLSDSNITQDVNTGAIIFNPCIKSVQPDHLNAVVKQVIKKPYANSRILNMYKDDVTPDDTMVATRLSVIADNVDMVDNAVTIRFNSLGSEIVVGAAYCQFVQDGDAWVPIWYGFDQTIGIDYNANAGASNGAYFTKVAVAVKKLADLAKFRFHPALVVCNISYTGTINDGTCVPSYTDPVMDLNNFTVINGADLERMHETALLSEFSCPQMGAFDNKYTTGN